MKRYGPLLKDICTQDNPEPILDILYWHYFDQHPMETEEISRQFSSLADILGKLPLKEHDRVWDLTCALCTEHEKKGFLEGIRMGAALARELAEEV